jgi:hypothetical protein
MSVALPPPIAAYFAADMKADVDALARCFGENGLVHDENQTYEGQAAIKQWNEAARSKYHYTVQPIEVREVDGNFVVTGKVSGDFPGSPTNLKHVFTLEGSKIKSLSIR